MVFNKNQQKQNTFKKEDQLVWENTPHEANFNPWKNYYAIIKIGDKSYITEYMAKFRSEAVAIFEEESRICGGKVEVIEVYK